MKQTIYRSLQKSDYPAIEDLIEKSFGLHHYISDRKTLTLMKHAYLQGCLAEQTYACVAEQEGKVAGIIMGKSDNHYRLGRHLRPCLATLWYTLRMELSAKRRGCNTEDYRHLHRIYRDFLSDRATFYDGVLTLFAVDAECRGYGIGTALLNKVQEYYASCCVKKIYLYTDSSCNTAFYDRHGFSRVKEEDMTMNCDTGVKNLTIFLYEKDYYISQC